jgi:hypothetical protein
MSTYFSDSFDHTKPFTDEAYQFALSSNVALTYTVPGNDARKYRIDFSWPYNANVWVGYNVAASCPAPGTISNSYKCELRPSAKFVSGGDVLSFISRSTVTDAALTLLKLPS